MELSSKMDKREQHRLSLQMTTDGNEVVHLPMKEKIDIYNDGRKLRACAYCRVSTDSDDQLSSIEFQKQHYVDVQEKHPNWEIIRIYADEGISGTSLKNRDEFIEMLEACERGEYDLIVTKSVSRFARNLVDCVSLARKLKNQTHKVGIYFETDNLFTLDADSELKLSILATFAQEESVKKSESMVWSLKERFKKGRLLTPPLYGYDVVEYTDPVGAKRKKYVINEPEAKIVRFVFDSFLSGYPLSEIAHALTELEIPTKIGSTNWSDGSLQYIIRNERYCGCVLTWKSFTSDIFEHTHKKNKDQSEREQYLYKNHHPAIVSEEVFDAAQVLFENNRHHVRSGIPVMHVIDEGIFKGFIPINHHWVNDDPNAYYGATNSLGRQEEGLHKVAKKAFSQFDFQGYQVVRGQFLTRIAAGPSITVSEKKIHFNSGCMRKFNDVAFVQLLLHPTERKIAIRPCKPDDIYAIRWRPNADGKITNKTIICQHFLSALFQIMNWEPIYSYRIRGAWVNRGDDEIIVFNLTDAAFVFATETEEQDTVKIKRIEAFPEEWDVGFGLEFYDYHLHNSILYMNPRIAWNAHSKGTPVINGNQVLPIPEKEIQLRYAEIASMPCSVGG